jgi:hypothetical protein
MTKNHSQVLSQSLKDMSSRKEEESEHVEL